MPVNHGQEPPYALGTGNSIPDYVPVEGFLAKIRVAQRLQEEEAGSVER